MSETTTDTKEIVIDDKSIIIAPSMIFEGSFSCLTCMEVSYAAVHFDGHLYWICPYEHENKIKF